MASGGAVDVAAEEVVDGDVPFPGEFEPVAGVPPKYTVRGVWSSWNRGRELPIRVEMSVCKAGDLSESTECVFESH